MTPERLEEIRAKVAPQRGKREAWYTGQHIDTLDLLAEVDRLREALAEARTLVAADGGRERQEIDALRSVLEDGP